MVAYIDMTSLLNGMNIELYSRLTPKIANTLKTTPGWQLLTRGVFTKSNYKNKFCRYQQRSMEFTTIVN